MASDERRRLVVLGAILGILLAVFTAKTFLLGGGDSTRSGPSATNPFAPSSSAGTKARTTAPAAKARNATNKTATKQAATKKKAATATPTSTPPATFEVYATKNPFEPVIQIDTGPTTPTTGGTGPTTPTTAPPGGATTTTVPSNEPPPGETVTLLDVSRDSQGNPQARVQVGSTVYTVGEGDTFANGQYRVVSLDEPCGQFLFGDSPFRLCEGEQTIK